MNNLNFRLAQFSDIPQLVALINKSYREQQDRSWTTELDWVEGQRITEFQLEEQLQLRNLTLLVAETSASKLIACIGLTFENNQVEIGTFCTDPQVQKYENGSICFRICRAICIERSSPSDQRLNVCARYPF